ncbi:MAG: BMP family ABC transporter substrate-binding protein [Dethiosulfovibrio peptidovorans]|nr:MAG: BMP family ABC transporter substrate-binding protein [Dethiosulfovibrio peptidovorans]
MKKSALILALCFSVITGGAALAAMKMIPIQDINVGFVYIGPVGDGGYTYMHDQGRQYMHQQIPELSKSVIVENVPEGPDAARVIETLIRKGCNVIFGNSFGYMDFMVDEAKRHPDVYFMHCSGYKTAPNMGTYFGRMYQPRFLSGIVAGSMTKSNVLGYVAAQPIPEVIRGINAFTLGARSVNPKVKVKVIWLFSWFDPGKEKEAAKALIDSGADVIGMHADSGAAPQACEEAGVYVIGYNDDMSTFAPTMHLTAPIWHWGTVYDYTVKQVSEGVWEPRQIWWGLKEGLVALAPFGKAVPKGLQETVESRKKAIISGTWDVFWGPIWDQNGKIKVPDGVKLTDTEMLGMDWFVQGVEATIPK